MIVNKLQALLSRASGYLVMRLYSAPEGRHFMRLINEGRVPPDEEIDAMDRAHEASEVVIFDGQGDIAMVVKVPPGRSSSCKVGIKASPDYLVVRAKLLDEEQRSKLREFNARLHAESCGNGY